MIILEKIGEHVILSSPRIIKCDSMTFTRKVGLVRWLKPRNWREWIFGRGCTFWKCVKCGEEFLSRPSGQCQAEIRG